MPEDLLFLSVDDVLRLHQDTIENEGGLSGVRDTGMLESAVLMPQQQFDGNYLHDGLPAMAAAYLFHLAQNHPFHDGNKRTAVLAALVFLHVNGITSLPDPNELEVITFSVASSKTTKDELISWMSQRVDG